MEREIVLDTETTGLDHKTGDRLIEIGCIELFNRMPTGREHHCFINPERDVPAAAEAVHGISTAFLADKPVFARVADAFLEFIGADRLIIHNASFDVGFLNAELERAGRPKIGMERVTDTLQLARRKHPAGPNSLDALCKRYGVDNSKRTKHGALVDSLLLAEIYVELLGVRQAKLELAGNETREHVFQSGARARAANIRPGFLPARLSAEDEAKHARFVETLGAKAVWLRYLKPLA